MNLENIAYLELSIIILAVLSMLASVYIIFKTSHKRQKEEVKQDKTEKKEEISWQKKLYSGLKKTKQNLLTSLEAAFKSSQSQEEDTLFKKIFETLIMADVGYETSEKITQSLREKSQRNGVSDRASHQVPTQLWYCAQRSEAGKCHDERQH